MRWSAALAMTLATGGCSVSLADSAEQGSDPGQQFCVTDEDCGEDATCLDGTCVGGETSFDTVLVEIAVPNTPDAGTYAGTRYLRTLSGLDSEGGRLDLELSESTVVDLRVAPPPCVDGAGEWVERVDGVCPEGSSSPRTCTFDLAATPLEVILTPSEWAQGLSTVRYTTTSECGDGCDSSLQLTVPPGTYDVYLRSDPAAELPEGLCRVVPEIFQLEVPADVQLSVDYALTPASRLDVEVQWPLESERDLAGWSIDVLDPKSGRRISTVATLDTAVVDGGVMAYSEGIDYVSPGNTKPGAELVRMSPPDGQVAPMIVMERSALELFRGSAVIDQFTTLPVPVTVVGQILARTSADDSNLLQSVGGTVTLVATELEGLPPGVLASYRETLTVAADDDGEFVASLLPGKYRVRVVPPGDCSEVVPCAADELLCECPLAATEVTNFVVATQPAVQAGKTVELEWQTRLAGEVDTAAGSAVAGAEVLAISVPQRPTALEVALGLEAFVPRASSGESDASGRFELFADGGSFNLSVRPGSETGLAWLVRPNVPVMSGSGSLDLEQLVLPLPVSYHGEVRVAGSTAIVPGATIRAYVPVDASDTVVQVAEATSNDAGDFQLLLPTSLR